MKRKITGFDKDDENEWRAKLECGHYQHLRHKPPLVTREWILTEKGRAEKLGEPLECRKCDEEKPKRFLKTKLLQTKTHTQKITDKRENFRAALFEKLIIIFFSPKNTALVF